jgi:endo-1,4-beta-xylanase
MLTRRTALQAFMLAGAAVPGLITALPAAAKMPVSLKRAFKGDFPVGVAVNAAQITGKDSRGDAIIKAQFNSISPENCLKWERIHPLPNRYDFALPDRYVAFGKRNHMFVVGHTLVWHNQTPDWVFRDDKGELLDRKALLKRLKNHIYTVVGRYKGKISSWDVVNEALNEDGTMRESLWYKIAGEDFIAKAFRYAHEADPRAELTYNDYNIENEAKRAGAVALIRKLKAEGVPITTVGIQGHYTLETPDLKLLDEAIDAYGRLGVKVAITELDVDVLPRNNLPLTADITVNLAQDPALNPYVNGLPDEVQRQLAERYAAIFEICLKHRGAVDRVTLWGVTDADSWHNGWPIMGRTAYSLLFDRAGKPKPAYDAVIKAAQDQSTIR